MKSKSTRILLILFAIGIIITYITGCGSDEDQTAEKPTETSSTAESTEEVVIASSKPIDYDAEKQAIQEVFSEFYRAFNDNKMTKIKQTWDATTKAEFAAVWVAGGFNEQVGPTTSWTNVESTIKGLWTGQGTAGRKWGNTDRLSEFWIRRKTSGSRDLEASAKGGMCFRPSAPGATFVYLIKKNDKWLIQQIDSVTQQALPSRDGKSLISNYFTDPDAKVK